MTFPPFLGSTVVTLGVPIYIYIYLFFERADPATPTVAAEAEARLGEETAYLNI